MAEAKIQYYCDASKLLVRIDALAAHVAAAADGDPVKVLADSIGAIDLDADTEILSRFEDGVLQVSVMPCGNLARLLDAYERVAS